jgi:hypothetical protein
MLETPEKACFRNNVAVILKNCTEKNSNSFLHFCIVMHGHLGNLKNSKNINW